MIVACTTDIEKQSNSRWTLKIESTGFVYRLNIGVIWKRGTIDDSKASGLRNQKDGHDRERETQVWDSAEFSLECAKFELFLHYQLGNIQREADTRAWKLRKNPGQKYKYLLSTSSWY